MADWVYYNAARGEIQCSPVAVAAACTCCKIEHQFAQWVMGSAARMREMHRALFRGVLGGPPLEPTKVNDRVLAEVRAKDLFLRFLTPPQLESWRLNNYIEVRAGADTYRIIEGFSHNVQVLDEQGAVVVTLCGYPIGVPTYDAMLAQKIALETNPKAFLEVAIPALRVLPQWVRQDPTFIRF